MTRKMHRLMWCGAAVLLFSLPAAAEMRWGQTVTVGSGQEVHEDLYAAASTVRVDGYVDGDLVASGGTVVVTGHVTGDLLAFAGTVRVSGQVDGSVRSLAGELDVTAPVGEDLLAGGGRVTLAPGGSIGRDVMAATGDLQLNGPVGGDVRASAGTIELNAPIAGAADLTVENLQVKDGAIVGGPLTYHSANKAEVGPGAELAAVNHLELEQATTGARVFGFFYTWARAFFAFCVLGLLLALVSPRFARTAPEVLWQSPWKSLGFGALVLLATPFAALALFMAGLVLGGWWLGLIAGGLVLCAVALSFPLVGYELGRVVVARVGPATGARRFGALLLGVAAVTLVMRVPVLGGLVGLGVVLFGLGAMLLAGVRLRAPASAPPAA